MRFPTSDRRRAIAILLSGAGYTTRALSHAIEHDDSLSDRAKLVYVGSNKPRDSNCVLETRASIFENEDQLLKQLEEAGASVILLAGYMPILTEKVLNVYRGRVLNVHPTLLPKYKGLNQYDKILMCENRSGITIHEVSAELDGGGIVDQISFRVEPGMTKDELIKRTKELEQSFYPYVLERALQGHYRKDPPS